MVRLPGLSALSLCVVVGLTSSAPGQSSNWSLSNPHPNPSIEYRLAVEEYRNALDRLGLSDASRSIHRFGESVGAWSGSRNDQITGGAIGMVNQIGRDMATRGLHLARLRLDNALVRLNHTGGAAAAELPPAASVRPLSRPVQAPNVIWRSGGRYPAPGFRWVTERKDDLRVVWVPGSGHPDFPNVIASSDEKSWRPASGYEWTQDARPGNLRVRPIRRQQPEPHTTARAQTPADGPRVSLGIWLKTCADGAHVTHVVAGSPATRCTDEDTREEITLEEGDHVVGVNGTDLQTHEQVIEAVNSTDRLLRIKVLDQRTGTIRNLVTVLR